MENPSTSNPITNIGERSSEKIKKTVSTLFDNQIASSETSPSTTINELGNQLKGIGSLISTKSSVDNSLKNKFTGNNNIQRLEERADSLKYQYHEYYDHLQGFANLFDPTVARQYAHTFFVETLFMLCDNATKKYRQEQLESMFKQFNSACNVNNLSQLGYWTNEEVMIDKTFTQTNEEKYNNFVTGLTADVTAQHEVNIQMITIDHNMRFDYLNSQLELINNVVNQQDVLIDSLKSWSHYLNKQAQEYAQLYETLSTQMTTYKRKDVFDIQESNSLDIWNKWSTFIFWMLVVIFVLMLVVQHYRSLASIASEAEKRLNDTASKAYNAITQVKTK